MKDFTFDLQLFSGDDTTIEITASTPHTFTKADTYTIQIGEKTYEITCTEGTTISTNSSGDVIIDGGNVSSTSTDIPFALTSGGTGTFTFGGTNAARTFKIDDKTYTITLNSGSTTISTNADGDVVVDGGNIKSVRDSEGKHVEFTLNSGTYTTNTVKTVDDSIIYLGDATNKVQFDARYYLNNTGTTKVTVTKDTSNNTYGVTVLTNNISSDNQKKSVVFIGSGSYTYTKNSLGKSFNVTLDSEGYTYFNFSGETPSNYNSLLASAKARDFEFRCWFSENSASPFFVPTGSSSIILRYKDSDLYLGNLNSSSNNFTTYSNSVLTYTVGDGIVMAQKTGSDVFKYWSTPGYYNEEVFDASTYVLWSDLNYDNSSANLSSLLKAMDGVLKISKTDILDYMKDNNQDAMFIVKDATKIKEDGETLSVETIRKKTYGTLTRTSDTSCEVKYSDNQLALTGIEIEDGLTVKIASHFTGIPIKYTASSVESKFTNLDSDNAYTVSSLSSGAISIGGSTAISLDKGTIRTDQEAQTIAAGTYSVSGYNYTGAFQDGITVYKSGDEAYVGDVESLEAFSVGDKSYRKTSFGLLETSKESDPPYGNIYKIFNSSVSDDIIQETDNAIAIKLSALNDESKKYRIIVPQESVSSSGTDTIKVLEIGGTNTINSIVYDSETNPQYAFAQITAKDNNGYLLETVSSTGTFSEAVNLISLSSGANSTSINSALTSGVQIYTSTTKSTGNYAKFQVTATDADYVVVSSDTDRTPTISGASKITLLEGSFAPSAGQVVTVGSNEFSLTSTTATTGKLTIAYDGTTATVTAYPGDTFKFYEKDFSVTAGDHITFALSGSELTISDLNSGDAFTYNGYTYTVGSSSFVREKGSTIGLWSKDSRTVESVTFSDMTTEGNWDSLVTISASTEDLTVPPAGFESSIRSAIIISKNDDTYGSTYGQIQLKDNGVYTLTKTTSDLGTLQSIIIPGSSTSLSLGSSDFTGATYTANGSTFKLEDDSTAGYQVTLSGGLAGVDGVSKATLTAGSLRAADSVTTYYVNSKAVNSANEVVLIASGSDSISSIGVGENFSINSTPYTLTKVGFMKTDYLLRGNNSPDQNINTFNLADHDSGDWVSLAAANNVTINSASPELFIVNDTSNPTIIYAELVTASGGYSLTHNTTWNTANKITVNDVTVTMSSGFKGASIAGTSSGANFVVGNLSGTIFTVTDNDAISGGLSLSGLQNITLSSGLVAPSSLKTIVAGSGNQTISNAQDISVSVNGSAITFGDLDAGETFTVGDTAYSLKSGLGLLTENKYWKANPDPLDNNATVTLSELNTASNWYNIAAVDSAKNLSVPSSTSSTTWIVMSNDRATRYGSITGSGSSYTLTKGSDDTAWNSANTIVIDDKTVSISNAFAGASIKGVQSSATFTVGDSNATYVVTDSAAASITGANTINQSAGTIALFDSAQTINANPSKIHSVSGLINVSVTSSEITFGDLDSGESFNVGDVTYTLRDLGRFQRSDGKLWSGDAIEGSITASALNTDSNWYTLIAAPSGKLEITSSATVPAYIVDNINNPTKIYGTLTKSGGTYTLTKDNAATDTLSSITLNTDAQPVTFSSDYANIPMTAGENQFTVTAATGNFTVTYSTVPSVSTAATALTLTTGSLTGNPNQTITANSIPIVVGNNSNVNVTYSTAAGVTVDDLSAGESVTINGTTYAMTTGSISVNVKGSGTSSETTVKGITKDDEFKIGSVKYIYTTAGLGKTDENKTTISYIIKQDVAFTEGDLTLDVLQATDEATWLAVSQVTNGNVVINSDLEKSVILINSLTAPTINYGQAVRESEGVYTLTEYDTSTNPELNTIKQELPSKITVDGVSVTIDDDFKAIPITATNATGIIVNDSDGIRRTITGTINQFVGSTMTFTPASGDNFTINGTEYEMGASAVGLINVTDSDIWTDATTTEFVLPSTGNWTNMLRANESNILDLSAQAPTNGDNIVIDNGANARLATLAYNSNESTYALTAIGSNKVTTIQLPTANITLTANFETTITTGTGTYTIGGKEYTGSNLTIESASETDSALLDGTVSIATTKSVKPTISDAITSTSGTITATAENGVWQTVGSLDEGDKFEISGVAYEVLGNNTLRRVTSDGAITIYNGKISDDKTLSFSDITAGTYSAMVMLNESNQLDLTTNLNITSTIVVGYGDPTTRIAQLSYNTATGYTLATTDDGNIDKLTAVLLGDAVKTFNTAIDTTVLTEYDSATITYLINNKTFAALSELTIATGEDSAILTGGKVDIAQGFEVTTRRTSTTETISSTAGDMAVEVNATAATVTISELDSGDSFTLDGTTAYTMTAIGLVSGTRLNSTVTDSVNTSDLGLRGKSWKTIFAVSDDTLTISGTDDTTEVVVADVSGDVAKKYGSLTTTSTTATLTQSDTDSDLDSITVSGVKATMSAKASSATITAGNATFTVTATRNFTVDATADTPTLSNVTAINLSSGTINAPTNIPITAGGKTITATSGDMTVDVTSGKVSVNGLDNGETFTADDITYRKVAAGLLDVTNQKLIAGVGDSYSFDGESKRIIAATDGILDLTSETSSADVYDSLTTPTTKLATLTINNGKTTLNKTADGITDVNIADGTDLTIDFAAKVNGSGTLTVNNKSYTGSNLVIDSTATDSTLYSGTATVAKDTSITTTGNDTLASTNGTISAQVTAGKVSSISDIDVNDSFTLGTTTYTRTAIGLIDGANLNPNITDSVDVTDLSGSDWKAILQCDGNLTINSDTGNDLYVVNIPTDKANAVKYGTLTKSGTAATLTQDNDDPALTSITVSGVKATMSAKAASATITAGNATFKVTATRNFTVDDTTSNPTLSNVTAINLSSGTINAPTNIPITASGKTITATSGDMTVDVTSGKVTVNGLDNGETFTADGVTYRKVAAGLLDVTNQKLIAGVGDSYSFDGESKRIIAATDGILDLTSETSSADVYDSLTAPTTKLATLTVNNGKTTLNKTADGITDVNIADGADLTIDFAAKVNGSGTLTVNNKSYTGTSLVIDSTADSSTLYSGMATVAKDTSITTTANDTLTSSNGTVTASVTSGKVSTISAIDVGDIFTLGTTTYTQTAIGLTDGTNLNPNITTSADVTDLSGSDWKAILQCDGNLTINSDTGNDLYVVNLPTDKANAVKYGTLTKSGTAATLTQDNDDPALTSITVSGVKATMSAKAASATITAGNATFKVTATRNFTVDATTDTPTLSNVNSITLTSGTINAPTNIPITAGGKTITATSGDMTVDVTSGKVSVNGLDNGETFTADGVTYRKVAAGLLDVTNQKLIAGVGDSYSFDGESKRIIAATDGILDLTSETSSADVYNSLTAPTTKLATLTINNGKTTLNKTADGITDVNIADGADLTIDFAAKVNGSGTLTVNNKSYTGTSLVIDSTATDSTLYSGTATVAKDTSITTTGNDTLASSNGTVTAQVTAGKVSTISAINVNDSFTLGTTTYTRTAIGLIDGANLNPNITTSANVTDLSGSDWKAILQIDGNLTIDSTTADDVYVVNIPANKSRAVKYGTIAKTGDNSYTMTRASSDTIPTSITVSGVTATLPLRMAGANLIAGDATFNVTASKAFTIDSTGTNPTISNVTSITLTSGTINAPINIPVTASGNVITATSGDMTVDVTDSAVTIGELTTGDTFTVGDIEYRKTDAGLLNVTNQQLLPTVTDSYTLGGDFGRIIAATNGVLDLTAETSSADVYNSLTAPTTKLATLTVTGDKMTLAKIADGINDIVLADGAILTVDFDAEISGSGTLTVNDKSYSGTNLIIDSTEDDSTLYSGTSTIAKDTSITTTGEDVISSSNGTITAQVNAGNVTNVSDINVGDSFTLNDNTYTQTAIGLSDGTKINTTIDDSVDVANLSGADWKNILQSDGSLTIDSTTADDVYIANIPANPANAVRYGALSKSDTSATLTQDDDDVEFDSIAIDGLKVTLSAKTSSAEFTATGATFNVTADSDFIIDATSDIPTINHATSINLSEGKINAPIDIPINASGNVVTATAGKITLDVDSGIVTVGSLNVGDSFTVGDISYTMTTAGLRDNYSQRLIAGTSEDYILGTAFERVIAVDGTNLDLTAETVNALVVDSLTNPTKNLATLTVTGGRLILNETSGGIESVQLASGADLTIDFDATITGSGTLTVNGNSFAGRGDLVIEATEDDSTLYSGTITLTKGDTVTTTAGDTLTSLGGTFTATATQGTITALDAINPRDSFTLNRKTYTMSNLGLVSGSKIALSLNDTTINIADLNTATWTNFIAPTDGYLDISKVTETLPVFDSTATPTEQIATLTVSRSNYTLTAAEDADIIDSVKVAKGTNLTVDFPITVEAPQGSVTVNGQTFVANSKVVLNADSNVTVYSGSITLNANNPTATSTDGDILIVENGSITAKAQDGLFTTVANLKARDSFTYNGTTYTMTARGIMNGNLIATSLKGSSINLARLEEATWSAIIAPVDGRLDLTNPANSIVVNDIVNPTLQIATLTVDEGSITLRGSNDYISAIDIAGGADLTIDFNTKIYADGSVTVNGKTFTGSDLVIDSATNPTLFSGTVTLNDSSVTTSSGDVVTSLSGELTVQVTPEQITINNFTAGNSFTLNDNSYLVSEIGLINAAGLLWADGDISEGLTADELTDPDNWAKFIIADGGVLNVDPDTLADGDSVLIVDDDYPTQLYGSLTKSDSIYHLSDPNNILEAINLTGIKIYIDNDLAYVPITTANSDGSETSFTVTPDLTKDSFLVDATGIAPKIDDVISIDIISGKIDSDDGQIVHPADDPTDVTITGGNGTHHIGDETFIVDGLKGDDKVTFYLDEDGNVDSILIPDKDVTVTIDGITYTAPADDSVLNFTDADGWYFDGYTLDKYTVTVDADGNITVDAGVKFTDVVTGGRTLATNSTINLATDKPVTIITARTINVTDSAGNKLADNLTSTSGVKFSSDGSAASDLADVAGAVFTLNAGQSLTAGGNLITALSDGCKVSVGADNLTFSAGTYTVNGQTFTASGTTQGTLIDGGIQLNITDPITVGDMTLSGGTAILADDVTLTGGVNVTGATGETFIVDGVATIDGKTVSTDSATAVTCAADGVQIGNTTLTVTGDEAYQINVAGGTITGLENIGSSGGVTVGGLKNATVKTDSASTFTAGDKTFNATNNLTYTIADGAIIAASDLAGTLSGDFSGGFTVNGDKITIAGNTSNVVGNTSGVTKVETSAQGSFTINGKTYEISGDTSAAFALTDGTVTGVESLESGNLIFAQNESNFSVNADTITFSGAPITLGVAQSAIASVSGLNGGSIQGLDNATVYGITAATINGTALGISTPYNAAVEGGKLSNLAGITSGTSISSAPSMTVTTAENGDFTFTGDTYTINDTLDGSVDFITDGNTKVIEVANFAGSISGNIDAISLNGKTITSSGEPVTITSDGTNITGVKGSSSIGGDIENIDYTISDGSATINGKGFELKGNDTDATIDGSGSVISGIEDYATLTFDEGGTYEVNGETVTVESGESITINRDGLYKFDGDGVISEKTSAEDIAPAILIEQDSSIAAGNDTVVVRNDAAASIDVSSGEPLIIPTSGKVTLENYHDNASVQTPAYNDLTGAIKTNEIKFGDGVMTLGDAVVSFSPANESSVGSVLVDLINAAGEVQGVGFTNTNGGTVDASSATSDYVVKGNYADSEGDTLKSGGSRLLTGSGNDTILAGGMDTIDAGGGYNVIYLTDENLRGSGIEGATLMISSGGKNTVHNFTDGYTSAADKVYVQDLSELNFDYGAGRLIISNEQGELTIPDLDDEGGYKLQITDGVSTYNAQVAVTSDELTVGADSNANYFYGEAINFSEYTGNLEVNLSESNGYMDGDLAHFHGLNKVTGGSGRTTLIGSVNDDTLIAGSGETSIWSSGGNDVMQGSTSADKNSASFYYTAGDGRDTITNFDFANSLADTTSDYVKLADNDAVTDVYLSGENVVLQINNSADDYLTLTQAKGQSFHLNDDLIAKVDDNVEFDGFSNVYVGAGSNSTLTVGEGFGDVQIWLSDELPEYHGTWYEGTFRVLDAGSAEGNDILAGNQLDNLIIGGTGKNSIWGGYGNSDDTLVGGSGQNTFYYELGNGNDVINNAHDGDIISLEDVYLDNILSADITSGGVSVDFTDGGSLTVNSNAAVEYRLADGTTYTADHTRKEWQ